MMTADDQQAATQALPDFAEAVAHSGQQFELRRLKGRIYGLRSIAADPKSPATSTGHVLKMQIKGSQGWIQFNNQRCAVTREPGWGDFVLHCGQLELARATKLGAFSWQFDVRVDNNHYRLKNASSFSSNFVAEVQDERFFWMNKRGFWTTRGEVKLEQSVPLVVLSLQCWLAMSMWIQSDSSTGVTPSIG